MAENKKILSPIQVCKKYIKLDWIYYSSPFFLCVIYGAFFFDFRSLQWLVNSIYQNLANILACIGIVIGLPNIAKLIYCQRKVLRDMPADIILPAARANVMVLQVVERQVAQYYKQFLKHQKWSTI